jgi:hypothetical protein
MFLYGRGTRLPRRAALLGLLVWSFTMGAWCGHLDPTPLRFWDEQYGLSNIEQALTTGRLEAASAHHPTLSYLPQLALVAAVDAVADATGSRRLSILERGRFTPLAYRLVRLTMALCGTLSVLWVFLVGRRLFDAEVGLLAALLLAVVPWHLRQSAIYKPDAQLVFFILLSLHLALRALEGAGWRRWLAAGAAVGLAAASKYNGVAAALPLAAGCAAQLRGEPRRLLRLAAAGLAAAAVFTLVDLPLLLRPGLVVAHFGETLQHYGREAALAGTGRLDMIGHAVASVVSEPFHGPVLGAAALLGLGWIAFRLRDTPPGERPARIAFLAFPAGYVALYALATSNPSPHNWLPLVPFTSLAAAFALAEGWRALRRRFAVPAVPAVRAALLTLLAAVLLFQGTAYAYYLAVPTTWSLADGLLADHLRPASAPRLVLQDPTDRYVLTRILPRRKRPLRATLDDWRRWRLDPALADVVVRVVDGRAAQGDGAVEGSGPAPVRVHRVGPVPFGARGAALEVELRDWQPFGEPVRLVHRGGGRWSPPPPDDGPSHVSAEVILAAGARPAAQPWLLSGDRRLPLLKGDRRGGRQHFVTPRTAPLDPGRPVRIEGIPPRSVRSVVVHGWRPGGG